MFYLDKEGCGLKSSLTILALNSKGYLKEKLPII